MTDESNAITDLLTEELTASHWVFVPSTGQAESG